MSQSRLMPLTFVVGAALTGGLTAAELTQVGDNPFAMQSLSSGYLQLASSHGGKDGEGKCGASDKHDDDAHEGHGDHESDDDHKASEGKCGANSEKDGDEHKAAEGKCGEGKCGASG